jgi:hypothetical protein
MSMLSSLHASEKGSGTPIKRPTIRQDEVKLTKWQKIELEHQWREKVERERLEKQRGVMEQTKKNTHKVHNDTLLRNESKKIENEEMVKT